MLKQRKDKELVMQNTLQAREYQKVLQVELLQIQREEREDNVRRIARAQEYQQKLILDKIQLDN
jgi:hypothetical protein